MTYWKAKSFINKDTFCEGNAAVIYVNGETFFALHGNLIAKIDKNDRVHIKNGKHITITTRNYLADIINTLKYPFTVRYKNADSKSGERIILIYKYPKDNKPPVKERKTHILHDVWTDLYQLKIDIENDMTINNTTDNTQLTNALKDSLNTIPH